MNGRDLALGLIGALALASVRARGSRNYAPMRWEYGDEDEPDFEAVGGMMNAAQAVRQGLELSGQGSLSDGAISRLWGDAGVPASSRALYLHDVAVAPELRGRGFGRRYVERVEYDAKREGAAAIVLHADHSLGFWTKLGYGLWPEPPAERPEISALLYKVLSR